MKKIIMLFALVVGITAAKAAVQEDTTLSKVVNGKVWSQHKVVKGETFYSLAKKYKTTVAEIQTVNNSKNLTINTFILLPTGKVASTTNSGTGSGTTGTVNNATNTVSHKVVKGETLSAIAKKYGTTVEAIKKANGLTSDNIGLNQMLKIPSKTPVSENTETPEKIETPVIKPKPEVELPPAEKKVEEKADTPPPIVELNKTKVNTPEVLSSKNKDIKKEVEERGNAKVVTEKIEKTKMQVLHPTIPEGNIIVIINPSNNKMAYCRVVGKFVPSNNDNAAVLMSPAVSEKLGMSSKSTSAPVRIVYAL